MKFNAKTLLTVAIACAAGLIPFQTYAQEMWSLERCVRYAQETNLAIQQANLTVKNAAITEKQALANRLPNLGAGVDGGYQFGRTIDPTSNSFVQSGFGYNRLNLTGGITVYNGGLIKNNIKQAQYDVLAARADAEQVGSNMALQVAAAYLNILLSQEQLENARRRVEQSKQQLSNTEKLIAVGTLPAADRLNLVAQIAQNEQQVVQIQNTLDLAFLNLKQLLQLEPDYDLKIESPENIVIPSDANPEGYALKNIFNTALTTQATIRAGDFRLRSAETGVKIAGAGAYPSVRLFGQLFSNYSTQAQDISKQGTVLEQGYRTPITVLVNGSPVTVAFPYADVEYPTTAYFKQLNENFGQGFGVTVDIPIYQNGRTTYNVQRSKLAILNAQIQNSQIRQQLKTDIQTAIANARAAKQTLEAAQKTFDAMKMAYENMQKRHALGAVNALELTTAKTNLDNSENDLTVARYDYLFKLKIIDFYEGKRMTLDK